MRALAFLFLFSCGCDDTQMMMSVNDLSVISFDDLSTMQCMGAAGTCQGTTCASGCKCQVVAQLDATDAGIVPGTPLGVCVCSPVVPFDGPVVCCGGVACLTMSSANPTCNGNSCEAP